jgi:hypothetical protein
MTTIKEVQDKISDTTTLTIFSPCSYIDYTSHGMTFTDKKYSITYHLCSDHFLKNMIKKHRKTLAGTRATIRLIREKIDLFGEKSAKQDSFIC